MIPFHLHTNYSFLESVLSIDAFMDFAKEYHFPWVAISDTNGMHGCVQFMKAAKARNLLPVIGSQIRFSSDWDDYVLTYAVSNEAYSLLCKIVTQRNLGDSFTVADLPVRDARGLIYITPREAHYKHLKEHGIENVYFEYVPVALDSGQIAAKIRSLNENAIIPVLSFPSHCIEERDFELLKIVCAIRLRCLLYDIKISEALNRSFAVKTVFDFSPRHFACKIANDTLSSLFSAAKIDLHLGDYKFPQYSLPTGTTANTLLWKICFEGLRSRYGKVTRELKDRLAYELEIIGKLSFEDYFLVVWDIVIEAKKRGMMLIGRGSAANSLVSYCLGFTEVDPMTSGFYFERFLNEFRKSPPDVDLDFAWNERDDMIKYVFMKYGYDRVAMICTTVTFRARSAFREVAKVFGFSNEEISKYSKYIPWSSAANLPRIAELFPEARSLPFDEEPWKTIAAHAGKLAGFPRHISIHPGGIIITPGKITDYVALSYARNKGVGLIVTQLDMYSIEELGLVKIDLLSQRSLGVVRTTLKLLDN